jgi:cyclic beta-1,2-glucan synthetase
VSRRLAVSEFDQRDLRLTARRTWRFFETFVTASDNMLPPDNFQEDPNPVIAHRTSPTNMGLYLLSAIAARDFGWAGTTETVERLEATLDSMQKLPRFNGHFFNWYGTLDRRALEPAYVSSVDSGNLAGHLIVVANACEEWMDASLAPNFRIGIDDNLRLASEVAANALRASGGEPGRQLASILEEIESQLNGAQAMDTLFPALRRLTEKAANAAHSIMPTAAQDNSTDLVFWTEALRKTVAEHDRDRLQIADAQHINLTARLKALAATAREMALARWILLFSSIPSGNSCRSAIPLQTIAGIPTAMICSLRKHGSPVSSQSRRGMWRHDIGFVSAEPPHLLETDPR